MPTERPPCVDRRQVCTLTNISAWSKSAFIKYCLGLMRHRPKKKRLRCYFGVLEFVLVWVCKQITTMTPKILFHNNVGILLTFFVAPFSVVSFFFLCRHFGIVYSILHKLSSMPSLAILNSQLHQMAPNCYWTEHSSCATTKHPIYSIISVVMCMHVSSNSFN